MLLSPIDQELLQQEQYAVIKVMYTETEHIPFKEDWAKLDKKVKDKLSNQALGYGEIV